MPDLSAETAYLFRHALLRDAAYQLQLPADRAVLHALALELCETILGELADGIAPELARHARVAWQGGKTADSRHLQTRELHWSWVAMQQGKARNDNDTVITFAGAVIESTVASGEQRCDASYNLANTLQRLGHWKEAAREFTRLSDLARKHDQPVHEGHAIYGLGYIDWLSGRIDDCDRRMDEWVEFTRALGNETEMASAMLALATMRFHRGELGRALELFRQWLPRIQTTADEAMLTRNIFNYGIVLKESGHFDEADRYLRQALSQARKLGTREYEGKILGSLGTLLTVQGKMDEALSHFVEAMKIARGIGDRRGCAIQLTNVGTVYQQTDRTEQALECYLDAAREAKELGAINTLAPALGNIGLACLVLGRPQEAAVHLRESVALWEQMKDATWEAYSRCSLARVLRMSGDYDSAEAELERADKLLEGTESWLDVFLVRGEQAHLALARGESAEAEHDAYRQVYERLGPAFEQTAGKDVATFEAAMQAVKAGAKLIHGARRETLAEALVKVIEG
ncbi:MAG: tetratricopeptide repeat protein [Planctomycetes bacterium]|nr:tetratricopeptide repeat protein [Planctomycetota bacterium]